MEIEFLPSRELRSLDYSALPCDFLPCQPVCNKVSSVETASSWHGSRHTIASSNSNKWDSIKEVLFGNNSFFFASLQDVKLNGNKLSRVPTEALRGPESLQNLQLQDNFIGKSYYKCLNCNVKNLNTLGAKIQNRIFFWLIDLVPEKTFFFSKQKKVQVRS